MVKGHYDATGAVGEDRPFKTRKLRHPEGEETADTLSGTSADRPISASAADGASPTPDLTYHTEALSIHQDSRVQPQDLGSTGPVTLPSPSESGSDIDLGSSFSRQAGSADDWPESWYISQMQSGSTELHNEVNMSDEAASKRGYEQSGEGITHAGEQAPPSEVMANSAAQMTRGGVARQHTVANDATTSSEATGGKHIHEASGYEWEKEEDAPGYLWKNPKAREEHARAMEQIVGKDRMIGRRYGNVGVDRQKE